MSCSVVDTFPKELFVVAGLNCFSSKTANNSDDLEDDCSDLDFNEEQCMDYNPSRVSFYPLIKCALIPSRKELRHFKNDLWFTRRELNELREQDNNTKVLPPTKRLSPRTNEDVNNILAESQSQFPTVIPKVAVRSKLRNQVVNLPAICQRAN